jgi:membrane-associated protease RseP (regulator of RpoE activity)
LFLLTLVTTTFAGILFESSFVSQIGQRQLPDLSILSLLPGALWYSGGVLSILLAHEMGHYLYCRYYNIDATLPYFIPAPFLTGTFGAVIRIREPFPTRAALFDVGVAGPIAGFVVLLPLLFLGMSMSEVVPSPTEGAGFTFGEPLLFKWVTYLILGPIPVGQSLNCHPLVFATWFGMFATALNLLPFGQLDGGHITYATLGRWSTPISTLTLVAAIVLSFVSINWIVLTVLMVVMFALLGPRHPSVLNEAEPLDNRRRVIAVFALIMLIVCFTPILVTEYDFASVTGR